MKHSNLTKNYATQPQSQPDPQPPSQLQEKNLKTIFSKIKHEKYCKNFCVDQGTTFSFI